MHGSTQAVETAQLESHEQRCEPALTNGLTHQVWIDLNGRDRQPARLEQHAKAAARDALAQAAHHTASNEDKLHCARGFCAANST